MSGLSCTYINRLTSDCAERAKARGVVMGRRPKLTPTNGQKPSLVAMLVRPWSPLLEPKKAREDRIPRCCPKPFALSGFGLAEDAVNRILNVITYVLAAIYFLVDAVFMAVAKPISNWFANHLALRKLRAWIRSLPPYPSLALFSVPVIILEPVKPVAAYLAATGQFLSSIATLITGELLKLVLVERLFSLTRDKLMKIPAFAWG
jgi:hypothetical protein